MMRKKSKTNFSIFIKFFREEKEKRFRKTNVRVVLVEDTDYQDTNIKVLKLVEVYEEGEFKREVSVRIGGEQQLEKEVSHRVDDDGNLIIYS